ncbi:MAG TPA: phosphate ABC transporter permease subunit PstC, partial [Accumulibacter sp.]|nr:phosphate ABC transporter permease subunit PstC [Accumulibacter sp.]
MASNIQALDNSATDNRLGDDFDRRNLDWYIDKIIACVVFICGISAILFVLGIFFFVTKEGIGFVFEKMDFREFFLTPYWSPSDAEDPEYGILALMAGTASVTGLAMLVAV